MGKKKSFLHGEISRLTDRIIMMHNEKMLLNNQIKRNHADYLNATTEFRKELIEKDRVINDLQNLVNKHHVLVPSMMQTNHGVPHFNNTTEYWIECYKIYYNDHPSLQATELTITDMINHFNTYILWKQSNV